VNANNSIPQGSPSAKVGSVGKLGDGRPFVLFERRLAYSVERVWAAITEPEQLAKWFPGFQLELASGGKFDIWFGGECDGPAHLSGTVTRYEPPNVLECGSMRFELQADGDGCVLTFTDILLFEGTRNTVEITNSVLGGWHRFLDTLEDALAGNQVERPEFDYSTIHIPGRE